MPAVGALPPGVESRHRTLVRSVLFQGIQHRVMSSLGVATALPSAKLITRTWRPSRQHILGTRSLRAMALQTANVDTMEASLKLLQDKPGPHFVLFTADPDPATGRPWCPDCARSEEPVRQAVQGTGGTLLEVQVGPRPLWKSPDHPYRHDSRLKLTGIPTLVKYEDGRFGDRVGPELESAVSPEDIDQVLQEFL